MKRIGLILISIMILLCLNCGRDASETEKSDESLKPAETTVEEKIILTINLKKIANKDLKNYIKSRHPDLSFNDINPRLASRIFDTFIEHKMIMHHVEQAKVPLDQVEIDNYLREKRLPLNKANDPAVSESIKAQKYLYFTLYKDIDVTDAEIRQYYERNMDDYRKSSEVFLHQIVVKNRDKAVEIHENLLKSPGKFAEIAKKKSISLEAKNGGRMGYFEKGTLPKDMEDVVFALDLNKISPVVKSPYGFHIFKVTKTKKERLLFLERVKDEIKNKLLSDKLRWAYEDYLARLKKELDIKVKYQSLFFTYQPIKGEQNEQINQSTDPNNTNNNG